MSNFDRHVYMKETATNLEYTLGLVEDLYFLPFDEEGKDKKIVKFVHKQVKRCMKQINQGMSLDWKRRTIKYGRIVRTRKRSKVVRRSNPSKKCSGRNYVKGVGCKRRKSRPFPKGKKCRSQVQP